MKALVLVVNGLRPDVLGCYGADHVVTPTFDSLAADSVVFDQHFAACPRPRASRQAWNGSPRHHLPDALWRQNVPAWLVGGERSPTRRLPFGRGWESTRWIRQTHLEMLDQPTILDATLQTALDGLEQHGHLPAWLMWVEIDALRRPWDAAEYADHTHAGEAPNDPADELIQLGGLAAKPPAPTAEASHDGEDDDDGHAPRFRWRPALGVSPIRAAGLMRAYTGIVEYIDELVGQFLTLVRELGLMEDLHLVVTSDMGLPLGEHGMVGTPRPWLHEELVHIPFLWRLPGGRQAGRHMAQLTTAADFGATLAAMFGVPTAGPGYCLLQRDRLVTAPVRESLICQSNRGPIGEWGLRTAEWYYLLPLPESPERGPQLYQKPDDRWEVNNVAAQYPDVAADLDRQLREAIKAAQATAATGPLA